MLKALFIMGGLAVAALGSAAWIFSLGQCSITYVLHLTVRDVQGQPMPGQPVIVWRRGYPAQPLQLGAAGQLSVLATESFGASALTGPSRPAVFGVRLQLPGVSPLFYWSDVARLGPRGPTRCTMIPVSANYTQWVGDFDAAGSTHRQTKPAAPRPWRR